MPKVYKTQSNLIQTIPCHLLINRALQTCHVAEEFCPELSLLEGLILPHS